MAESVLLNLAESEDEQRDRRRRQNRGGDIQSSGRSSGRGGKHAPNPDDQRDDEGWDDKEYRSPVDELGRDATGMIPALAPAGRTLAFDVQVSDNGPMLGARRTRRSRREGAGR
jgi:hypothetical protein